MDIRRATIDDFEKVLPIKLESKEEERKYNPGLEPIKKVIENYKGYLRNDIESEWRAVFIAEDKEVIGIIVAKVYRTLIVAGYERRGYLTNLYVKPKFRRKGIGKELFNTAVAWLKKKKAKGVTLEIHSANKDKVNFYHKFGFKDFTIKMVKKI